MTVYFDMDGTIADLYGVENWLANLVAENERPYVEAKIIWEELNEILEELTSYGINIGIVSWLAKNSTKDYDRKVRVAKKRWLSEYFTVNFSEIHIVKYGTPKSSVVKDKFGILFDDEEHNRNQWKGNAYPPNKIFEVLNFLIDNQMNK